MSETVGSIVYEVDMDTAAVTKGADRVNVALDSVGKGADKLDKAMNDAAGAMGKVGKATESEAASLRKLLGQIDPTVAATGRLEDMQDQLNAAYQRGLLSTSAYNANLAKLDAQFKKVEGGTKRTADESDGLLTKLKPLGVAIAAVVSVQSLKQMGELAEQFTLLQSRITRLSSDSATASATYQSLLSIAGQTGQTLPATVKLWETLTSSLKSLGASNSDVVTLTGTLQKIGKIGGSSAEETANALRQLGQSLAGGTLRAEEYNSIVEQTPELVRQLATASGKSMGEFRQAMLDGKITSQQLFDLLLQRVPAVDAEFQKLPRSAGDAGNAVSVAFGAALSKLDQVLGTSQKLARALDNLAGSLNSISGNLTGQEKLNALLEDQADIQRQIDFQNQRTFGPSKSRLEELAALQAKNRDEIELTRKSLSASVPNRQDPSKRPAATTSTDGQKVLQDMAEQNAALRAQGVERAQILAVQKLGNTATQQEIDLAKALAADTYKLQQAEKQGKKDKTAAASEAKKKATAAAAAARKAANEQKTGAEQNQKAFEKIGVSLADVHKNAREVAQDQAALTLNKYATPEQVQTIRDIAGALYDLKQGRQDLASVDPIAAQNFGFEDELTKLQQLNDQKLLSDQRYLELKGQAERANAEQQRVLAEENFAAQSKGNALLIGTLNQLQTASAQAFVGLVTSASSGTDAVKALAGAILNEAVSAVVAFGFAQLKSLLIGQSVGAAATAQAVGEAGIAASAWATPAALASLATLGANAVPAGAALTGTVGIAQGLALGARQYGGPVDGAKMYRVNETGAPEIFNAAGGKQYMMPNTRGEVVSNKDATSGGGSAPAPVVNVNNYSGQGATAKTRFSEADRKWVVDVLVGDMNAGGKSSKTVNQITGTQRKGS